MLQAGTGDMGKHPLGLLQAGEAGQPDGIDPGRARQLRGTTDRHGFIGVLPEEQENHQFIIPEFMMGRHWHFNAR